MNTSRFLFYSSLLLFLQACTVPKITHGYENSIVLRDYVLPPERPDDDAKSQLEAMVAQHPENAEFHRDLGALYQSRTTIVPKAQKLPLILLANKHLEKAWELNPEQPQTMLYLGLARAAKGSDPDLSLIAKVRTVLDGFRLMDAAVEKLPENYCMRMLRAKAGSMVPAILGRGKILEEDLSFIRQYAEPEGQLPTYLRVLGLITLGDAVYSKDETAARAYWQQAADLGSNFAEEALWRLNGDMPGYDE